MATSGVTTFTTTRDQIIRASALEVSAIGLGVTMSAEMLNDFAFALNAMIKHWQGRGLKIWTVKEGTLFPFPGQTRYGAGTGATDHITESWKKTTLSVDEASGQTILGVESSDDIINGDQIGIIRVVDARRYVVSSAIETPIDLLSHQEYRALPSKASVGSINLVQYDPQRVVGYFNLWNVPAVATELLNFTFWKPVETFTTGGDNPDLPEEWVNCIKWNLALEMMGRYPVNGDRRRLIAQRAADTLVDMEGFSREDTSIRFQPARRR
jgi:hypothetical protein